MKKSDRTWFCAAGSFCMGQTLVNGGFGAPDADDGGGDLFPAVAAAYAVHPQAGALLVAAQRLLGAGTKDAVDTAAGLVASVESASCRIIT